MKSHVETKLWIFSFDLVESILAFPGASMSNGLSLALYQQKVTATDRRKDFKVSRASTQAWRRSWNREQTK